MQAERYTQYFSKTVLSISRIQLEMLLRNNRELLQHAVRHTVDYPSESLASCQYQLSLLEKAVHISQVKRLAGKSSEKLSRCVQNDVML